MSRTNWASVLYYIQLVSANTMQITTAINPVKAIVSAMID